MHYNQSMLKSHTRTCSTKGSSLVSQLSSGN